MVDTPDNQLGKGGSIPTPTLHDAVIALPLFYNEKDKQDPTSPLQFDIVEISTSLAQELNALWHSRLPIYQTGFLLTSKVCYGALYSNKFYAVAIWGHPNARLLPQETWLELKRLAICQDAPRNTASRMISVMTRLVKSKFEKVIKLISYQDTTVHKGTIYRASGWKIGNVQKRESKWGGGLRKSIDPNTGKRRNRPDLNKATGPKIRWEKDIK